MATIYKSKIDTWILVVLIAAMAICVFASVVVLLSGSPDTWWTLLLTVGIGIVLPLWLLVSTHYTLDSKLLVVRSGPLKWRVPITDIVSITSTESVLSGPALSLDRLCIDYGHGSKLVISPRDKEQFLREIEALRRGAA
jgi:hypothetical protein